MSPTFDAPEATRHNRRPVGRNVVPSRLIRAAERPVGREKELRRLERVWKRGTKRVLVVRGIGGEGKSLLVEEWARRLARRDYDGASYFDWSFHDQGSADPNSDTADLFIATALRELCGDDGRTLADSAASQMYKAARLLEHLRQHRTLLILDGLDPLQFGPGAFAGRLKSQAVRLLILGLARAGRGLCVVTTRVGASDLPAEFELALPPLSEKAGSALLASLLEPKGRAGVHQVISTVAERKEITRAVKGHALTLRLLGGFIYRALRDVRRWREVDYSEADAQYKIDPGSASATYGHAFSTIEAYERWLGAGGADGVRQLSVLRLLGLYNRPAGEASLAALRSDAIPGLNDALVGIADEAWDTTLSHLEECGLVSLARGPGTAYVDAHPLTREFFANRMAKRHPRAWRAGHARLYEYLRQATRDKPRPDRDDLEPLYDAVKHGCKAGLKQDACDHVFSARIHRGQDVYSIYQLGAFGSDLVTIGHFFDQRWTRVSPELDDRARVWLLGEAGLDLWAVGHLELARSAMTAARDLRRSTGAGPYPSANAGRTASFLSEVELALGNVADAVDEAARSLADTDPQRDGVERLMTQGAKLGNALHQAARLREADDAFRQAEAAQARGEPDHPLLHSVPGFMYCDLLLGTSERAAWHRTLESTPSHREHGYPFPDFAEETSVTSLPYRSVASRVNATLKYSTPRNRSLLSVGLDFLTLGRVALYEAILERRSLRPCAELVDSAIQRLEPAGRLDEFPKVLLTRAWLRSVAGLTGAADDLDHAWDIAERGSMLLHAADVRLYRARLFFRANVYPWGSPAADLEEAEKLIARCGYHRRDAEVRITKETVLPGHRP